MAAPAGAFAPTLLMPSAGDGPATLGRWRIEKRLGAGAMGEVFLASRDGQRSALKLVSRRHGSDQEFLLRFKREVAVAAMLDHPHIARSLDGGEFDGRPWLAMEYIDGPDVDSLLKATAPSSSPRCCVSPSRSPAAWPTPTPWA